jgi:hypothetical protein
MRTDGERLRRLLACGLVDSFGLALGWTVFLLLALRRGGLVEAALLNAAMLVGIVLAAPAATWLSRRCSGRGVLRAASAAEAALRVGTLCALLAGWPAQAVAIGVAVMYLAGFTGFAAMRAEVAAIDARPRAMTGYAMCIAAVEACGAGLAALLPTGPLLPVVGVVYAVSLVPTFINAQRSRVPAKQADLRVHPPFGVLAGGATVAFLASGPTLLAVGLAGELYGQAWVAGAAATFSAGCLLSTFVVDRMSRLSMPPSLEWPLWGVGMLAGWIAAPWHPPGLLLAQLLSGLCLTAFEGSMDARAARGAAPGTVTTVLAWTAATRAMGGAVAVRMLPMLVAAPAIGAAAGAGAFTLAAGGLTATVVTVARYAGRAEGRHGYRP